MRRYRMMALITLLVAACKPNFDDQPSLIEEPRVLAVQSTPAEAAPGSDIQLRALWVDPSKPSAPTAEAPIEWAVCRARKSLSELGPVSSACLQPASPDLVPLGIGLQVAAKIPSDVCRIFGPNPPESRKGGPAGRPVDPDQTGGFYLPIRLRAQTSAEELYATGETRILCDPARITPEQAREWTRSYRTNENPRIDELLAIRGERREVVVPSGAVDEPMHVAAGEKVALRASWAACPDDAQCGDQICGVDEDKASCAEDCADPRGCTGRERYVAFDPLTLQLMSRREGMRVSWYATAGTFEASATGTSEADQPSDATTNSWSAPGSPGRVEVWAVVRDDRRGVSWESYVFVVE